MPRGGARPGAGRKTGSLTKRTAKIAELAAESGITPLEVMLAAMRDAYTKREFTRAASFAKDAAPYMHPRLASVDLNLSDLTDEDLRNAAR